MIQLHRDRERHAVDGKLAYLIPGGLRGHYLRRKNRLLLEHRRRQGDFGSGDFKKGYWKPAKEALRTEAHGKCAYCEAPTQVVAHGDVEHYRPKSRYWWLAYCYDNYLYACQVCNQVYKVDNFPIQGHPLPAPEIDGLSTDQDLDHWQSRLCPDPVNVGDGYTLAQHLDDHRAEGPLLLHPYFDEPDRYVAYEVIPALEEVYVVAAEGEPLANQVVEAMVQYYGLNREELLRRRYLWYLVVKALANDIQRPGLTPADAAEKKALMKRLLQPDYEYTGMAHYFVYKVWELELD
jgi:5-methylcytosine-specific restriction endonuclease McrA